MKKSFSLILLLMLVGATSMAQVFTGSFKMIITGDNMKQPIEMMCYYKDKKIATEMSPEQMKGGKMRMIYDYSTQEGLILMDMNGNKMGFKSKTKELQDVIMEKNPPKITETNESKTIDGHSCKKFISETEDAVIDLWVAQDMDFDLKELFVNMKGAKGGGMNNLGHYAKYFKGPSLETVVVDKKKGSKATVLIKDIQKRIPPESVFSSEGYNIMSNPMMGGGKKE
ncbi:DUF4412 domain-containing protein [Solitalea lacus]|uniref:DUF4412 domain-containing protein n=1 Tax=Solitalea lacus TaxID=2911172 RepID=UPI001EDC392E|nr:DUF4412 domain-containing protein [Solitalea lacus]UKJ08398.1 DUF4412 domain-containing protein [Solitalea lacus]